VVAGFGRLVGVVVENVFGACPADFGSGVDGRLGNVEGDVLEDDFFEPNRLNGFILLERNQEFAKRKE
jgi:hypothetical protein